MRPRPVSLGIAALLLAASLAALAPSASAANDAGSGGDAGNTHASATRVVPVGRYYGELSGGDVDYFKFFVAAGKQIDIDVSAGLTTGQLQAFDANRRIGVNLWDPNGVLLDNPVTNVGDARVAWPRALIAGEYRLSLDASALGGRSYSFCFVVTGETCATYGLRPIDLLKPLPVTHARVLLVPPSAIDPTAPRLPTEYLDATLAGIRAWDASIAQFAARYPAYAYLAQLTSSVEIFDGAPDAVGYDVIIVWSPYTGPMFRGLAADYFGGGPLCTRFCAPTAFGHSTYAQLRPFVHDGTRLIVMSSFASAPRGGQVTPDFPEPADVYNVMQHEFAHTWGLGHSQTWTAAHGPDLMNSPYAHVFGDGDLLGDGGERTKWDCVSTLDLHGMGRLYEWVGRGVRWDQRAPESTATLPPSVPYELMCG